MAGSYLSRADLKWADLSGADLSRADFSGADLKWADLSGADLSGADLDFSCLPLWCGSLKCKVDERIIRQVLYHTLSLATYSGVCTELLNETNLNVANKFHKIPEVPKLKA